MSVYWISFRIANEKVGNRSYDDRLKALNDTIGKHCSDWWGDTTSFYAFESIATLHTVAIAVKQAIAPTHDVVIMRAMDVKEAYIIGAFKKENIFKMLDYLKKV